MVHGEVETVANQPSTTHAKRLWPWLLLLVLLSRLAYYAAGIRFSAAPLYSFWQFIDPELLRQDLARSILQLHAQPPLFNALLGIVLKLFASPEPVLWMVYMLCGVANALSLFALMQRLGVSRKLGFTVTAIFVLGPSCILYENWLFYTYPIMTALLLAALSLERLARTNRLTDALLFFALLAVVALSRSLFHVVWLAGMAVLVAVTFRQDWKRVAAASAIPLLLVVGVYAKNACLFSSFSASTWSGMSLCKLSTQRVPEQEREALVRDGELSELALIPPFSDLTAYERYIPAETTGIPVLDRRTKSTGYPNLNHIAYVAVSRQYLRDAVHVIVSRPAAYLRGVVSACAIYCRPPSDNPFLEVNREPIRPLVRLYDAVFYGRLLERPHPASVDGDRIRHYATQLMNLGLWIPIVCPLLVVYGLLAVRNGFANHDRPRALTMLFVWVTIVYVTVAGNLLEAGENNRFRFLVEPFYLVFLALLIQDLARRFRKGAPQECAG